MPRKATTRQACCGWAWDNRNARSMAAILEILRSPEFRAAFPNGATVQEVAALAGRSDSYVRECLRLLKQAGLVEVLDGQRHMAIDADQLSSCAPLTVRQWTPEERERVLAGVRSYGPLEPWEEAKLEEWRRRQKAVAGKG